jgi:hypothetical protein
MAQDSTHLVAEILKTLLIMQQVSVLTILVAEEGNKLDIQVLSLLRNPTNRLLINLKYSKIWLTEKDRLL